MKHEQTSAHAPERAREPPKLNRDMRRCINKAAWHSDASHFEQFRAKLTIEVEQRIAKGETLEAITTYLQSL